ncbi:hypothetical protein DR950_36305 [Kitasatospora xanthocidica]|uniref:Uncharacterized protein n=1 Tax=Kitasatospora xanthocidica TaxID=83382 RepID=A0A373A4Y5_9ACTN|nr:hypothetical protein [Kitasatospora xanthocidica]RGD62495.1 hypothetical protein DR950_36305 [Kitasatospora xanthocidica]
MSFDISAVIGADPEISGALTGVTDVTTQGQATFSAGSVVTDDDQVAVDLVESAPEDAGLVELLGVRRVALLIAA